MAAATPCADILGKHNKAKSDINQLNVQLESDYGWIDCLLASLEPPANNQVDLGYVQMVSGGSVRCAWSVYPVRGCRLMASQQHVQQDVDALHDDVSRWEQSHKFT